MKIVTIMIMIMIMIGDNSGKIVIAMVFKGVVVVAEEYRL
jgi:hypothetical protein